MNHQIVGWTWAIAILVLAGLLGGEIAAWLLIVFSYILIFISHTANNSKTLSRNLLITTSVHHIISLTLIYYLTEFSKNDPLSFHMIAQQMADSAHHLFDWNGEIGHEFYIWCLSKVYFLFGTHWLTGQTTSVIATIPFLVYCYKIGLQLGLNDKQASEAVLLIGLAPGATIFTVQTQRETWKVLLLAILLFSSILYFRTLRVRHVFGWLSSSLLLLMLHKGFAILSPALLLLPYFLLNPQRLKRDHRVSIKSHYIILIGILFIFIYLLPQLNYQTAQALISGDAIDYAETRRDAKINVVGDSRAAYGIAIRTNSLPNLIQSSGLLYIVFLSAPYPWQLSSLLDIAGMIDANIGLIFIVGSIFVLRESKRFPHNNKKIIYYLLAVFILVSFLHALGTINYGTAVRHRIMSYWIVILIGWPFIRKKVEQILSIRRLSSSKPHFVVLKTNRIAYKD